MTFWILTILAAILTLLFIRKFPFIWMSAGDKGEYHVEKRLKKLDKEKYFVINDLLIQRKNGRTSQIDHVVVSPYGIFVIETKNISGYIYGSEYGKKWVRHWKGYKRGGYYGEDTLEFDNPVLQNGAHVKALYEHLGHYAPKLIPIIAFSPEATLKVIVDDVCVTYWTEITDIIKRYHEEVISVEQAQEIYHLLLTLNIQDEKARQQHVIRASINKNNYKE